MLYTFRDLMDRMGSRVLQQILNEQLGRHIKEKLPSINTDLKKTLKKTEDALKKYQDVRKQIVYVGGARLNRNTISGLLKFLKFY